MHFVMSSEFGEFGDADHSYTKLDFQAESIYDILPHIEQFLMGAGFTWLRPGELQLVREEEQGAICGQCNNCDCK